MYCGGEVIVQQAIAAAVRSWSFAPHLRSETLRGRHITPGGPDSARASILRRLADSYSS